MMFLYQCVNENKEIVLITKHIKDINETLKELNDSVENQVLKNIFEYYKDKTIIYVSHKNKKNYFGRVIYV